LNYAHKARLTAEEVGLKSLIAQTYTALANSYQALNMQDSGYYYLKLAAPLIDSLNKVEKNNLIRYQNILFTENQNLQKIEQEKTATQTRIRIISLLGTLGFILLIALLLYRNNRQKQKTNKVLESTLNNLKSTQQQLIQSEKMASLGELTAGIAHEIQNPLNFVNNFSEVNAELIDELEQEANKGNLEEVKAIAKDIKDNEEKINHHGKRADAIVKGMLQHSRSSTGQKEPTDINALCDEYLRLSYHGLRAKEKSFNATMKTDFDSSIGIINIIPQDIGRVVLNLINNAFYAVDEKKKSSYAKASEDKYEPTVSVRTKKMNGKVEIKVSDNGNGIPQKILEKIFQPFFTTKPTGQGTGLGLSLSYDIVKAHGGELKVETKEGEGSEFIVSLPQ
jgi:signal transduction histidine kinase